MESQKYRIRLMYEEGGHKKLVKTWVQEMRSATWLKSNWQRINPNNKSAIDFLFEYIIFDLNSSDPSKIQNSKLDFLLNHRFLVQDPITLLYSLDFIIARNLIDFLENSEAKNYLQQQQQNLERLLQINTKPKTLTNNSSS